MFKSTNLDQFPFPFTDRSYRYSNDLKELHGEEVNCIEITPEYKAQVVRKREMLEKEPEIRFQSFPHTMDMQWEVLEMLADMAAVRYPEYFKITKEGNHWTFENRILGETETFIFGDETSIPYEPLDFIGRHFHNDFVLMVHRDDNLYLEVAQISYAALFSANWNKGMSFDEIHAPVPFVSRTGVGLREKVRRFLLSIEPGAPRTRINWNLMANRWDVNYETMDVWGPQRLLVNSENAGKLVHLRVEEQKFYRMPRSDAILFVLNTQFLSLEDLQKKPEWLDLTYSVLRDIPETMAEYKGIAPFLPQSVDYLKNCVEKLNAMKNL